MAKFSSAAIYRSFLKVFPVKHTLVFPGNPLGPLRPRPAPTLEPYETQPCALQELNQNEAFCTQKLRVFSLKF
jgi:hypothetical protein